MDDETRRAIEILANILYLLEHDANSPSVVRSYLDAGNDAIQHLQEVASRQDVPYRTARLGTA
jgi:hypothetical protein